MMRIKNRAIIMYLEMTFDNLDVTLYNKIIRKKKIMLYLTPFILYMYNLDVTFACDVKSLNR